ncbi:MAG: type II toxin-antitoxin system HicA family toxin [Patescibacteria group bacterium]|nr:type II toxin-antitoxin system HicA family toxin [Patescibacteria group bacterium]
MLKPIHRRILIKKLKLLGFEGPYSGGKHQFMTKNNFKLSILNPHNKDIGIVLLAKIIKELNITSQEFMNL